MTFTRWPFTSSTCSLASPRNVVSIGLPTIRFVEPFDVARPGGMMRICSGRMLTVTPSRRSPLRLAQVGTPGELYHRPRTSFVADFIGQTNLMKGTLVGTDGDHVLVETGAGRFRASRNGDLRDGVTLSIRPEQMRIVTGRAASSNGSTNRIVGRPIETTFLGEASEHVLDVNGQRVKVISAPPMFEVPGEIAVEFDPEDVVVLAE